MNKPIFALFRTTIKKSIRKILSTFKSGSDDTPKTFARSDFIQCGLSESLQRLARHNLKVAQVMSIGAGSGGDTLAICQQLLPRAPALMIEAQTEHKSHLAKIKQRHPHIDYVICAAASTNGSVSFMNTSLLGGSVVNESYSGSSVVVPARTIDSLAEERNWAGPFFLKFDTHGVELEILAGAQKTLKRTSLIMMEVYNFHLNFVEGKNLVFYQMCEHLNSLGFRCVDLCAPLFRPGDGALWQMHLFFIRKDHSVFKSNSYSAPPLS